MADAELLPFDFRSLTKTVQGYVKELVSKTDEMREATATENELISTKAYELAQDRREKTKLPLPKPEVPYIDFSPLQNALSSLEKSSNALAVRWQQQLVSALPNAMMNQQLYRAEQQLLTVTGLPRRAWYKHTLYAPGFYTGYGVKTLPGIREAIEQRNWIEAKDQILIAATAIDRLAIYLGNLAK
jgi:N-acetylated-alpha-linked acidic dipeptidase